MTPEEQSRAIDELEASLERLHALYNQYFMGIEKLEPLVPRKSVERKINLLRKEKLKSTALRFRFQTQIQKYNTHTNYWRRICRQIEEGTYKRHLLRAQKRTEEKIRETLEPPDPAALSEQTDDSQRDTDESPPAYDLGPLEDFDLDDPFAAGAAPPAHGPSSVSQKTKPKLPGRGLNFDDIDDLIAEAGPKPRGRSSLPPPAETREAPGASSSPAPAPPPGEPAPPRGERELEDFFSNRPPPPPPAAAPQSAPVTEPKAPLRRGDATPTKRVPVDPKARERAAKENFDETRAQVIYRTFLAARKRTQESTDGVSFERVKKSLEKQYSAKGGRVDFKVVIRDGKAVIAAVPKKD